MTADLGVGLAHVHILERERWSGGLVHLAQSGASPVSAGRGVVVVSALAAVVGEEAREHPAEQRSQGRAAAGNDGKVDLDGAEGVADCVPRVIALDVELSAQLVYTNDGKDGDTKR